MTQPASVPNASEFGLAVRANGLGKEIDGRAILRNLNFDIPRGQCVALLGANGAGKSTLLKMFALLTTASQGELCLLGQRSTSETARLRARLGLIGHAAMLYRDLSAKENLVFFGKLYGVPAPHRRAMELLEWIGLSHRADDAVKSFSRGMVQRVAIARALMHKPDLLLADEPFAGLDAPSTNAVQKMLLDLHEQGHTVILANHDIQQSLDLAQRVMVLRRGGLIVDEPASVVNSRQLLREVTGP